MHYSLVADMMSWQLAVFLGLLFGQAYNVSALSYRQDILDFKHIPLISWSYNTVPGQKADCFLFIFKIMLRIKSPWDTEHFRIRIDDVKSSRLRKPDDFCVKKFGLHTKQNENGSDAR